MYSLSKLPSKLEWGRGKNDDTLVNPMTNVPAHVWIVGEVNDIAFVKNGSPMDMVTIWMTPLVKGEVELASDLVCKNRFPVEGSYPDILLVIR